jgi:hypothetical protein
MTSRNVICLKPFRATVNRSITFEFQRKIRCPHSRKLGVIHILFVIGVRGGLSIATRPYKQKMREAYQRSRLVWS